MPRALKFTLKGKVEGPEASELSSRLEKGIFSVGQQMSQLLLVGQDLGRPSGAEPVAGPSNVARREPSASSNEGGSSGGCQRQALYMYYSCSPGRAGRRNRTSSGGGGANQEGIELAEDTNISGNANAAPLLASGGNVAAERHVILSRPGIYGRPRSDSVNSIDWWGNRYSRNDDLEGMTWQEWKQRRCGFLHPSCIPITVILILIFLVVLLPLLDRDGHSTTAEAKNDERKMRWMAANMWEEFSKFRTGGSLDWKACNVECQVTLVETIPEKMVYNDGPVFPETFDAWTEMIGSAKSSLDLAVFYWSLTAASTNSSAQLASHGEAVFNQLKSVNASAVRFRIVQNSPSDQFPNTESDDLTNAEVRNIDIAQLTGGVQHTKMLIADGKDAYVGSANMDWRALSQVKELGVLVKDCPCLVTDLQKVFEIYWLMGKPGAVIPSEWPEELDTEFNMDRPMGLTINGSSPALISVGVSPPEFRTDRRDSDLDMILRLIDSATRFVYVAVMDYFPSSLYMGEKNRYWDEIDTALRRAAFDRGVQVRVMASVWKSTRGIMHKYLRSLKALGPVEEKGLDVDAKLFRVPVYDDEQAAIPFARVNHNKYMVTETTAFVGTSNWSEDYFTNTAGVGISFTQSPEAEISLQRQLKEIFLRDWNSQFVEDP